MSESCQQCRKPVPTEGDEVAPTIVLTPDALFVEYSVSNFGDAIFELDLAFYWCNVVCFGRWVASRCALQAMEDAA